MTRHDGRQPDALRDIRIERHFTRSAPGSVYIQAGRTTVLCTASVNEEIPPWKRDDPEPSGWITAEYAMLPGSTAPRKRRERSRIDGRSQEIQRLIGRSLRAIADLHALGPRTITIDCDVLEADGGTRTLSITGGFIALVDALKTIDTDSTPGHAIIRDSVAAISVGISDGVVLLDLDYQEDSRAEVDSNIVMTGSGEFIEIQGTAEGRTFDRVLLDHQLDFAIQGISQLTSLQRQTLGDDWPLD